MTTWAGSFRGRCASPVGSEGTVRRDDSRVLVAVLNRSEPLISPARTHQSSAGRDGRPDSRCERGGSLIVLWIALTKAGTPLKITLAAFLVGDRSGMRLGDHDCFALAVVIRIVAPGPARVSRETIRTMHDKKSRHGEQEPCVPKTDSQASSHGFAPIAGIAKMRLVSPRRAQEANQRQAPQGHLSLPPPMWWYSSTPRVSHA